MEDSDEIHKFLVLLDVHLQLLDSSRVRVDIFLDCRLRLEEAFQGGLAKGHLLKLGLLVALLRLSLRLEDFLAGAS